MDADNNFRRKNPCVLCDRFVNLPESTLDGDQAAGLDGLKMPEILAIYGLPIGGQLEKSIGLLYKKQERWGMM